MAVDWRTVKSPSGQGPAGALSHCQPLPHPSSAPPLGELGEHSCCVLFIHTHAWFLSQNWCMCYVFLKPKKKDKFQVSNIMYLEGCMIYHHLLLWVLSFVATVGQEHIGSKLQKFSAHLQFAAISLDAIYLF